MDRNKTYLKQFLEMLVGERGVSLNTLEAYRRDLSDFLEVVYTIDIKGIQESHIQQYLATLYDRGLKEKSVARKLSALRQFYSFLCSEGICKQNPTRQIPMPKLGRSLPKILEEEEINQLVKAIYSFKQADKMRLLTILELLYATGARVSELVSLKISSFSADYKSVLLVGKGSKERLIPLNESAAAIVKEYIKTRCTFLNKKEKSKNKGSLWLFPSNSKFGHITRQRVGQLIKDLACKAKIDRNRISPHIIRHAFATHLLNYGADLLTVQELLGHTDVGTTQIYTHVQYDKLKKIMEEKHPLGKKKK